MKYLSTSIILFLFIFSCKNESTPSIISPKDISLNKGTQQMVDSLKAIYARTNFEGHKYESKNAVLILNQKLKKLQQEGKTDWQLMISFAKELLNAGETRQSLNMIQTLYNNIPQFQQLSEESLVFYQLWAIAWMRMGEQDNCISNHSDESCVFPIRGKGIHKNKEGSQNAIKIYKQILEKYPNNFESKWLLNIAYMTLGEYPNNVPTKWRLSPQKIKSDYQLPEFKNISMDLGLDVNSLAGGSVVDDFNNDGYLDIVTSSWGLADQIRYFINNGDGTFSEQTQQAGLTGLTGGLNMTHADFDNDGFLDIFVLRGGWYSTIQSGTQPNSLLRNNGDGTFSDVTISSGLYSVHPTQTAVWWDFNLDGHLDLFIGNEFTNRNEPHRCEFYKNNGDGTFTDLMPQLNFTELNGFIKGVNSGDINNDGYPDLYISFLSKENVLLINRGVSATAPWSFQKVSNRAGVQKPFSSFPTWFFDYNNDGWEDIFVAAYDDYALKDQAGQVAADYWGESFQSDHPRIYLNSKDETFKDVSKTVGINKAIHTMGCNYGDLDNDGFLDFYLGTGAPDYRSIVPNRMFRNNAGKTFQDVTTAGRFGLIQKGHGVSFADIDNDGDQDIYTTIGGALSGDLFQNALFQNPGNSNNWVVIKLEGKTANRCAIGSRIHLEVELPNGSIQNIYSTVTPGASFGANSLQQEIGLGKGKMIKSLKINWANKDNQYIDYGTLSPNQKVLIQEDSKEIKQLNYKSFNFQKNKNGHQHHH